MWWKIESKSEDNFFYSEYLNYPGYVYDKNHDYWRNGFPQGLDVLTENAPGIDFYEEIIGTFAKNPRLGYGPQVTGLPTGASPRTISAWVRKDASGSAIIFTYGLPSNNRRYCLCLNDTYISAYYYNNTAQVTGLASNMIMHKWHHYLHVFDGNTNKFYIDGIQCNHC